MFDENIVIDARTDSIRITDMEKKMDDMSLKLLRLQVVVGMIVDTLDHPRKQKILRCLHNDSHA